jgi:dienelactone hydrolase
MLSRAGFRAVVLAGFLMTGAVAQQVPKAAEGYKPTEAEKAQIIEKANEFARAFKSLEGKLGNGPGARDAIADVEICGEAAEFVGEIEDYHEAKDVARLLRVLDRGMERASDLAKGRAPWAEATGSVVRGYRSKIDGTAQPYAVIVPQGIDPDDRIRLDVVLHGRDAKLNEVRFFDAHDGKPAPADLPGLVLHVFGRGNNAYRWAGEVDVYEAIDAVKRNYRVDDRRIVLRGFSMGGAGAWHLGLHDPSRWSSVEAGAGFTETMTYAKLRDPSEVVRKGLRIYDAVDYAVNAFDVPIVGYGGENDPQNQASKNIEAALVALGVPMKTNGLVTRTKGVDFLRVVGKGMGHAVDKDSAKLMKEFHDEHAQKGTDLYPRKVRFATYTLKYNHAGWLTIKRLGEHYRRATLEGEIVGDLAMVKTENVEALAIARQVAETIRLDGQEFPIRTAAKGLLPDVYFLKTPEGWTLLDHDGSLAIEENPKGVKHPGLQGPIDDAFTGPFLMVIGKEPPTNKVQEWALFRHLGFLNDFAHGMRGIARIKFDVEVTEQDIQDNNLILFGDPSSNKLIARVLPGLPLTWTATEVKLDGTFPAADHVPVLIQPNPLNRHRYVVINSGHTFGAKEFAGTNALLYPHLGDYAVFKIGQPDEVKAGGYFDEAWKKP